MLGKRDSRRSLWLTRRKRRRRCARAQVLSLLRRLVDAGGETRPHVEDGDGLFASDYLRGKRFARLDPRRRARRRARGGNAEAARPGPGRSMGPPKGAGAARQDQARVRLPSRVSFPACVCGRRAERAKVALVRPRRTPATPSGITFRHRPKIVQLCPRVGLRPSLLLPVALLRDQRPWRRVRTGHPISIPPSATRAHVLQTLGKRNHCNRSYSKSFQQRPGDWPESCSAKRAGDAQGEPDFAPGGVECRIRCTHSPSHRRRRSG
jgi:hypothetical protein